MKAMIISDIHGYSENLEKVIKIFKREKCTRLIVLGDILYPGPDAEKVKDILNKMRYCMLCMEGNNDRYIFSGELEFKIIRGYLRIKLDDNNTYITHGHQYNKNNMQLEIGDVFIQGHTHSGYMYVENNKYFLNPGSISLPRDNTDGSYIIYEKDQFYLFDIEENLLSYLKIEK